MYHTIFSCQLTCSVTAMVLPSTSLPAQPLFLRRRQGVVSGVGERPDKVVSPF